MWQRNRPSPSLFPTPLPPLIKVNIAPLPIKKTFLDILFLSLKNPPLFFLQLFPPLLLRILSPIKRHATPNERTFHIRGSSKNPVASFKLPLDLNSFPPPWESGHHLLIIGEN